MEVVELGLLPYAEALAVQTAARDALVAGTGGPVLFLVEHPPVITLGAAARAEHLLSPPASVEVVPVGRGGDVTVHEPGQLVAYPVVHLDAVGRDLHRYMRVLEEAAIETCASFGVPAWREAGLSGAWTAGGKVCAVGVQVRRWVAMHGLALNVSNSLETFRWVVPCGLADRPVTTLARESGRAVSVAEASPVLAGALAKRL